MHKLKPVLTLYMVVAMVTLLSILDLCHMPPESGPCRAAFSMWHCDASAKTCVNFIYGGCYGNANRFSNLEDCQRKCGKSQTGKKTGLQNVK